MKSLNLNPTLNSLVGVLLLSSVSIEYQTAYAATIPAPATNTSKIELTPITESRIAADGRSRITFSGRILDASGQPIEDDAIVTLTTSGGKFIGVDVDLDLVGFQVRAINGAFTAELQSDLKPQKVELRAGIDTPIAKSNPASNSVSNPTSSTTSSPSVTPAAVDFHGCGSLQPDRIHSQPPSGTGIWIRQAPIRCGGDGLLRQFSGVFEARFRRCKCDGERLGVCNRHPWRVGLYRSLQ